LNLLLKASVDEIHRLSMMHSKDQGVIEATNFI